MDSVLYTEPLGAAARAIASDLAQTSAGKSCAGCGKLFNAARAYRGVFRALYFSQERGCFSFSLLLCRKCTRAAKSETDVLARLKRQVQQDAALLELSAQGNA